MGCHLSTGLVLSPTHTERDPHHQPPQNWGDINWAGGKKSVSYKFIEGEHTWNVWVD